MKSEKLFKVGKSQNHAKRITKLTCFNKNCKQKLKTKQQNRKRNRLKWYDYIVKIVEKNSKKMQRKESKECGLKV